MSACREARRRQFTPVPGLTPKLTVVSGGGTVLGIELMDAERDRFALPRDARMAMVIRYVGENPPRNRKDWGLLKSSTTTRFSARLDREYPPGTNVWVAACWTNSRGERGPWSEPVWTRIQFDGPLQSLTLSKAA